jgi:hypothetical protein
MLDRITHWWGVLKCKGKKELEEIAWIRELREKWKEVEDSAGQRGKRQTADAKAE